MNSFSVEVYMPYLCYGSVEPGKDCLNSHSCPDCLAEIISVFRHGKKISFSSLCIGTTYNTKPRDH